MKPFKTITLEISGLGIILYSPYAVAHIKEGEDYLQAHYLDDKDVQRHIQAGGLVAFATTTPGTFIIKALMGYPDEATRRAYPLHLRLGILVKGRTVCIRDLYDLMDWSAECPPEQRLELEDGYYHITLCSRRPPSGILGDNQTILMYFNPLDAMPDLATEGIPTLE